MYVCIVILGQSEHKPPRVMEYDIYPKATSIDLSLSNTTHISFGITNAVSPFSRASYPTNLVHIMLYTSKVLHFSTHLSSNVNDR
jgi:hypothetical protein